MNNQKKESLSSLSEAGEDFEPTNSERASKLELAPQAGVETSSGQNLSEQREVEMPVSGKPRLMTRARQAQQNFVEHRRSGWTSKEIISHYLNQLKGYIAQPQGNLHEAKQKFAQLKAKFQALMSERR